MWRAIEFVNKVLKLNTEAATFAVVDNKSIQYSALQLNRQVQLYNMGVGVDNKKLRSPYARGGDFYSRETVSIKEQKGQPTDRVTLRDTGAMYNTMKSVRRGNELFIVANTIKDGKDLEDVFGAVIGLNVESKKVLVEQSKPIIKQYVKGVLL